MLRWNLSSINGFVQSVSLTLNVTDDSGGQVYELYEVLSSWSETSVAWNNKPTRGNTVLGTVATTRTGALTVNLNANGIAVVQKWLNTPSKNYGLYLLHTGNTNTLAFDSRERSTASFRPKLTVTYIPPSLTAGPAVTNITATSVTITWETDIFTKSKIRYRKQGTSTWTTKSVKTVLTGGKWRASITLTDLTPNTTYEYQVTASADSPWTNTLTFRTLTR